MTMKEIITKHLQEGNFTYSLVIWTNEEPAAFIGQLRANVEIDLEMEGLEEDEQIGCLKSTKRHLTNVFADIWQIRTNELHIALTEELEPEPMNRRTI